MQVSHYILFLGILASSFTACSDKAFTEINTDPNRPSSVPTPSILVQAEKQLMDNIRSESINLKAAQLFSQYYSQNIYTDQSRYDISTSFSDGYWSNAYKVLNNLTEIITINTNEATKSIATAGTAGSNVNQIAIARTLKAYVYHNLTDVFGDIPYESYGNKDTDFEALQQEPANYTPRYATQEKIYVDLLNELKSAADTLYKYRSDNTFGKSDIIYEGANEKWFRFANSLRLRLSNRMQGKNKALADQHFKEALAQGVISGNSENATFKYSVSSPNEAPLFRATVTANRKDYAVSHVLINVLKGELGPIKNVDPRLSKYALPNASGQFIGQPYGLPLEAAGVNGPNDISLPSAEVNAANFPETLLEFSEVQFLISEHNNWDESAYRNGVKASLEKWNVAAADVEKYLNVLPKANKEQVLTQKYLALYTQGIESWSEIRRTGYPLFLVKKGDIVWNRITDKGTVAYRFEPIFGTTIPNRLYYPIKEQTTNKANYQAALAKQGDDVLSTKIWWNK
ncbi:SusD/RagB family nutrient-binding outer membrane lipoprotein [Sphingobacteriaceae bacterium WQ 2009]|uniref:SusD/RagB family nutrient-binding outer membrane lipoprotein n=2 Tax=Rhinopithecimicrobium faecis TaxID=2820698 RepID=A0A8T4HAJ3_9SPHI|nr:SusD/RagB family nutrient-binding outer membrane lipoprotein [Sphingobacteriaceae bacterium WQ 2009]